ncbi:MAG: type II toxin-antitoxin system RelE/ParE family toxin [Candidatus Woesearchaeota archaeon]
MNKVRDEGFKLRIKKQINKIIDFPETGKPMRYKRKGTREVYISPFRLAYAYLPEEDKLIFLDIYHKGEQ